MRLPAVPVPARPAMPSQLVRTIDVASSLEGSVRAIADRLDAARPAPRVLPSDEALQQAREAIDALASQLGTASRDALAIGGTGGSHERFSSYRNSTKLFEVNARWIGVAAARIGADLATALRDHSFEAFGRASGALTSTILSTRDIASEVRGLHENRYANSAASWASKQVAAFDVDGDGAISLGSRPTGPLGAALDETHTDGSQTYGMITDASKLFAAADRLGNRDGLADPGELARLASPFDRNRNGWVDVREAEGIATSFPSRHYMPRPGQDPIELGAAS